jgi:hypothetical protein
MRGQINGLNDALNARIDNIPAGPQGEPGPPFAGIIIDGVTTLPPGEAATVTANLQGDNMHLLFGLPRGADGSNGTNGSDGTSGSNGSDGAPDEVSAAQLAAEIAGTSANTNSIALLNFTVSDPPTQADLQAVANKLDELINALRR